MTILLPKEAGLTELAEQINGAWQKDCSLFFSVEEVPQEEFDKRLAAGSYTIALAPIRAEGGSVYQMLQQFTAEGGGLTGWSDPIYSQRLAESAQQTGSARCALLADCERQLLEGCAVVPLLGQNRRLLVADGITGLVFDPFTPVLDLTDAQKTDILRPLTIPSHFATINEQLAGLAHPVERLLPKQQAAGSGPVPCSKNKRQTVEYRFAVFAYSRSLQNTKGLCHDLCSPAALLQMQKFLQRQRIRPAIPDDPRQAHRAGPGRRRGCHKEESILTVDYWPDPWTIEKTDPALRVQKVFPLTDEGREATAAFCRTRSMPILTAGKTAPA